MEYRFNQYWIN